MVDEEQVEAIAKITARMEELKARPKWKPGESRTRLAELSKLISDLRDVMANAGRDVSSYDDILGAFSQLDAMFEPEFHTQRVLDVLFDRVNEAATPAVLEKMRKTALASDPAQQRELLFLIRFGLTDDPHGVVIRGHVMIDNALTNCIESYLPNRPRLGKGYPIFRHSYMGKVAQAHSLGILNSDECQLLRDFNALRIDVAHKMGGTRGQHIEFSWKDEKPLWENFIKNSVTRGRWPKYDESAFPQFLRYIVIFLYLHVQKRADNLLKVRLPDPAIPETPTDIEQQVKSFLTLMIANIASKIGDFRGPEKP